MTWIVTRKSLAAAYGDDDDKDNNDDGERFNKKRIAFLFLKCIFLCSYCFEYNPTAVIYLNVAMKYIQRKYQCKKSIKIN